MDANVLVALLKMATEDEALRRELVELAGRSASNSGRTS